MSDEMPMQQTGFTLLWRSLFHHPYFKGGIGLDRAVRFMWLWSDCAFTTTHRKVGTAYVTLERGQTARSVRTLGKFWGWHPARVQRLLTDLKNMGMIRTLAVDTGSDTASDTLKRSPVTVITVCNYSHFNGMLKEEDDAQGQLPIQGAKRGVQQSLDLRDEFAPKQTKQPNNSLSKGAPPVDNPRHRRAPPHGKTTRKGNLILTYIYKNTDDWEIHVKDFKERNGGAEPMVDRNGGYWFRWSSVGEERRRSA